MPDNDPGIRRSDPSDSPSPANSFRTHLTNRSVPEMIVCVHGTNHSFGSPDEGHEIRPVQGSGPGKGACRRRGDHLWDDCACDRGNEPLTMGRDLMERVHAGAWRMSTAGNVRAARGGELPR